jgi:putative Ca2+/H+ antiporter (TMEM165/GDT1 family)
MAVSVERIEKYRRWFGWAFLGSFLTLLFLSFLSAPWLDAQFVLTLGSLITAVTTLLGFLVTTVMTWRKERRESNATSVEPEKNKLELEKLRREIGDRNAAAQEKKKKMSKRRRIG